MRHQYELYQGQLEQLETNARQELQTKIDRVKGFLPGYRITFTEGVQPQVNDDLYQIIGLEYNPDTEPEDFTVCATFEDDGHQDTAQLEHYDAQTIIYILQRLETESYTVKKIDYAN